MLHLQSRLRPRLFGSTLLAIIVYAVQPQAWATVSRFLVAWDVGVVCYLALAGIVAARSTTAMMQKRAAEEDEKAVVFLILTLSAAVASLAAIGIELAGIHNAGGQEAFRLTIAAITILCSWFFVHTIYAIHYAHEYYGDKGERRGLIFPHDDKPDYWDFLYFSFNFGAAAQTSDVMIVSKRMRRLSLAHAMLAFLFNTTILALAVNVGAGLL
ncbi:DUF1345 domain-containing protein [Microvirga sp. M2]|uniref:DUF1345 domain-containing protein n=1 Tax=Microvirga sp. M2 TaxID=3073270 RepID=UPI0039C3E825